MCSFDNQKEIMSTQNEHKRTLKEKVDEFIQSGTRGKGNSSIVMLSQI